MNDGNSRTHGIFCSLINKTLKIFKTEIKVLSVLRVLFIKNKTLKTFKTEIKVLSVLQVLFIKNKTLKTSKTKSTRQL